MIVTPATMLQHNWFKIQNYYADDEYAYLRNDSSLKINKVSLVYKSEKEDKAAALNFHLSARERNDVIASFNNVENQKVVSVIKNYLGNK